MVARGGRHAWMADGGDEQPRITRARQQRNDALALIVEIFVHEVSGGRRAPGEMAAREDAGGPVFEPAILVVEMYADGQHPMRGILGPARAPPPRHVRPRIDVPLLSAVGARLAPRGWPSRVGAD